jgi:hypothetical protein
MRWVQCASIYGATMLQQQLDAGLWPTELMGGKIGETPLHGQRAAELAQEIVEWVHKRGEIPQQRPGGDNR